MSYQKIQEVYKHYGIIINSPFIKKKSKEKYQVEFEEYKENIQKIQKRKNRRKTILDNIKSKHLQYYVTFTLKKDKQQKDFKKIYDSLRKILSRYEIDYVLIPELTKTGNIHFHGFIGFDPDKFEELIQPKIINNKIVFDDYGNQVLELIPVERNYGFTQIIYIGDKEESERRRIVNYIIKYIIDSEFKILSSRTKNKALKLAINIFGSSIVKHQN